MVFKAAKQTTAPRAPVEVLLRAVPLPGQLYPLNYDLKAKCRVSFTLCLTFDLNANHFALNVYFFLFVTATALLLLF